MIDMGIKTLKYRPLTHFWNRILFYSYGWGGIRIKWFRGGKGSFFLLAATENFSKKSTFFFFQLQLNFDLS